MYEKLSIFVQKNRPRVRKLADAAQGRPKGVGDEVDIKVGGLADDNHDVILDGHGQAVETDVAVGGIYQVIDFLRCDGLHGVVVCVGTATGLDFNDMQPI